MISWPHTFFLTIDNLIRGSNQLTNNFYQFYNHLQSDGYITWTSLQTKFIYWFEMSVTFLVTKVMRLFNNNNIKIFFDFKFPYICVFYQLMFNEFRCLTHFQFRSVIIIFKMYYCSVDLCISFNISETEYILFFFTFDWFALPFNY